MILTFRAVNDIQGMFIPVDEDTRKFMAFMEIPLIKHGDRGIMLALWIEPLVVAAIRMGHTITFLPGERHP